MALRNKIDSNETGLSFAKEVLGKPGILPGPSEDEAIWYSLEPNEYNDFGGEPTLLARRPINSSRQRKKGAIVDLAAQGGFNQDFTNENSLMLTEGFMYAAARRKKNEEPSAVTATGFVVADEDAYFTGMLLFAKGFSTAANNGFKVVTSVDPGSSEVRATGLVAEASPPAGAEIILVGYQGDAGTLDITVPGGGNLPQMTSSNAVLHQLGIIPGEMIFIGGDGANLRFAAGANNGIKRVKSVTSTSIVFDKSDSAFVAEASTTETVQIFFGSVIKNELAQLIVRQSFQLERSMGAPEQSQPTQIQAEYVKGAFPNEMEVVIESADKVNTNFSFVAITNEHRKSTDGLKPGTRVQTVESDAYNTSTDFQRIKLASVSSVDEAPIPLFAFVTELTLKINNNVSLNKAVGYLGGFDASIGLFEVSAEISAYFTQVESQIAIKDNIDVTLDCFITKENKGVAFDLPLIALGGGLSEVELDEPIMIPLESEAATAAKISPTMDHTLLWVFFDYLPTYASA